MLKKGFLVFLITKKNCAHCMLILLYLIPQANRIVKEASKSAQGVPFTTLSPSSQLSSTLKSLSPSQ